MSDRARLRGEELLARARKYGRMAATSGTVTQRIKWQRKSREAFRQAEDLARRVAEKAAKETEKRTADLGGPPAVPEGERWLDTSTDPPVLREFSGGRWVDYIEATP